MSFHYVMSCRGKYKPGDPIGENQMFALEKVFLFFQRTIQVSCVEEKFMKIPHLTL